MPRVGGKPPAPFTSGQIRQSAVPPNRGDGDLSRMALSRPSLFYVQWLRKSARSVSLGFCMSL